jgi:hypothetical protein
MNVIRVGSEGIMTSYKMHIILFGVVVLIFNLSNVLNVSATSMGEVMKDHNMTRQEPPADMNSPDTINVQIMSVHGCLHNSTELPEKVCSNILLQLPANCALFDFNYCNDSEIKQYVEAHDFEGVEMYNQHVDLEKELGIRP